MVMSAASRPDAGQTAWRAQRRRLFAVILGVCIGVGSLQAVLVECWSSPLARGGPGGTWQGGQWLGAGATRGKGAGATCGKALRCRDARSAHTALHAKTDVEVIDSKVNSSLTGKSFMALSIGGQTVNVTWNCREERGDVDCTFQVNTKNSTARYSDHSAEGEGWSITSKKFELQSPTRSMHTVAYTIANPYGIDQLAEAPPAGQVSIVFEPSLDGLGVTPAELLDIVEAQVPGEDVRYWPSFRDYWKKYV